MFGIIRIVIGFLLLIGMIAAIKKLKVAYKHRKYIGSIMIATALVIISAFIPFENTFITFDSPSAVYEYVTFGKADVKLVVSGKQSDLVIGDKNQTDVYLIVPKTHEGWKVGLGINTKRVVQKISNGITIYIYRYKNTNDYFVTILDTAGGYSKIADSFNSSFSSLKKENEPLKKTFVTYYTNVSNIDSEYWISVNGEKITPLN